MINLRSIILLVISYVIIPRLTFLPPNVHSLLSIFGPFLIPLVFDWIKAARTASPSVPIRPTPPRVQYALNLLFLSAVVCLGLSLSRYAPENIFLKTQSHIRTEPSVLFIVTPHIFQLAVLGLATSSLVGAEGSRFRIHATIAGIFVMVVEIWYMGTYDILANKRAKYVQDLDSAYWRVRFLRYITFALVDMGLAYVLWATSTNRLFAKPISIAERIEVTTRTAEDTFNKTRALGLLTNSVNRDPALRGVREEYWRTEGQVTAEVVQDEVVTEQINAAISRLDMGSLEGRVGEVADGILAGIDSLRA
ncbi:hypothetical protein GGP41_009446 [Bipolaris sorokiniana]|uniref:Uncharacterized protein n=1 Tax=Cochliobolus sativus TaxID=45130 RepID=A0A8H6DS01_COCSA|nr:hypothetical protein GGP41_009446 [Bipolaris sorokiniana]